ncbi:uncharacterized protein RJT20DRAFT_150143 [Scheffersomyces xylosifermentans]|uniref:uncharacterized protein n=1 Tax=Scheffersomyces xylosifermentans TaxID=1304137 RepID=UPI00315DBEBA
MNLFLCLIVLDHIPTPADTIAHLKLLRAFAELKVRITKGDNVSQQATKTWQVFVTNSTRRFIIFITALKEFLDLKPSSVHDEKSRYNKYDFEEKKAIDVLDSLLPHWMLSCFYDNFVRSDFLIFAKFPLPLLKINEAIDNKIFEFKPKHAFVYKYLDIISSFTSEPQDLIYEFKSFSMFEPLVSISCPSCHQVIIENAPHTNDKATGFADPTFSQKINYGKCRCQFDDIIIHSELRKRQLAADVNSSAPLPGLYKYFSNFISDKYFRDRNPEKINDFIKKEVARFAIQNLSSKNLEDSIQGALQRDKYKNHLVGCVLRQGRFVEKITEIDWLHSPALKEGVAESIIRYSRFFKMLTLYDNQRMLVPTLDIDLVWHTHQLSLHSYFSDCLRTERESVIDHDDKVEEDRLDDCFDKTAKSYKYLFKQDYSICYCWYCVLSRGNSQSKISSIFGKKKSKDDNIKPSPLFMNSLGITHISIHNSIILPNTYSEVKTIC